ncbi:YcdB/YcdC domain-containing protein [Paenibacillus sp. MSJ-34]|uniref:YcdB/YcdC domain-containing protein n=1 Tax=Paenibacillus sp. MSJ-34 TaxID=2841529 RepID=UPI001C1157A6|nr:YcdB/YcdC domain-containing protein [Paenibacillus sp. MSJ-34]MBU5441686.1 S-layer homology domain-containing protein [Paenibacillus sp. MSJ-34]
MKWIRTSGIAALAATLLVSVTVPAAAKEAVTVVEKTMPAFDDSTPVQAKISKEQAIEIAKKNLRIPSDYKLSNVNLRSRNTNGVAKGIWYLNFQKTDKDRYDASISAGIDADSGQIIQFYSYVYDPNKKPSYPPKVDRAAAKTIAVDFMNKIDPGLAAKVKYNDKYDVSEKTPLGGEVQYVLQFDRMEQGLPVYENEVRISVDGEGHVLSYDNNWNDALKFEPNKPAVDMKGAEAAYRELLKLVPHYVIPYQAEQKKGPYVSYEMIPYMIDAASGKIWSPTPQPAINHTVPISDKPLGDKPQAVLNITKEQAVKTATEQLPIPQEAKLTGADYNEYADEMSGTMSSQWSLEWRIGDDERKSPYIAAGVNTKTGEILYYSYSTAGEASRSEGAKLSDEQAKAKAVDFVKRLIPYAAHELYLQDGRSGWVDEDRGTYSFTRVINGIYADNERVEVSINKQTGNVDNYYNHLSDMNYGSAKPQLIGEQEALEKLLATYSIELGYVSGNVNQAWDPRPLAASGKPAGDANEAKLVYQLIKKAQTDEAVFLDATSGKWRNRGTGEETSLEPIKATDIDNHPAKRELELMIEYRAIDVKDGKVNPDAIVTRGELIKMLVMAMSGGVRPFAAESKAKASFSDVGVKSEYFAYVESALDQKLIDPGDGKFNPEGKITREEMAELITRALGYNSLAERGNLFQTAFQDADAVAKKGQAAIVVALGIMDLQGGKFEPKREVTRAEGATAFYRYLQERAQLKEAPLRY